MSIVQILERYGPPAPPPIFLDPSVDEEFWVSAFDVETGEEAWQSMVDSLRERSRPAPVVTSQSWSRLLDFEVLRRGRYSGAIAANPDAQQLELKACEQFGHWFNHYSWIENPHAPTPEGRDVPFVPWPGQVLLLQWWIESLNEAMRNQETARRTLLKSRSVGASWCIMHVKFHRLRFELGFSGKCGSIGEEEADNGLTDSLMGKLRFILHKQPRWLRGTYRDMHLLVSYAPMGSRVTAETMNSNFGRSGRATAIFRDELAAISSRLQTEVTVATTSVSLVDWFVFTPRGRGNPAHDLWESSEGIAGVEAYWTIDPRRDDAWWNGLLIENGGNLTRDARAQEYGCSFAGVSGHRIWSPDPEIVLWDEDDPEWQAIAGDPRRRLLKVSGMDFGSGPSPTVMRTAVIDWEGGIPNKEYGRLPRIWWAYEQGWWRANPEDVAAEALEAHERYPGEWYVYGDPAGKATKIGEHSWQNDLAAADLEIFCLPEAPFHERRFIHKALDLVNEMMRLGLWRVHRSDCVFSTEAEEQWQWDIPQGLQLGAVNKADIKWRKDGPSHWCEAGWYGAMAAILYHQPKKKKPGRKKELSSLTTTTSSDLKGLFG